MLWPYLVSPSRHSNDNSRGGFGLVELMVSVSIMVIVAGLILSRQTSFNSAILLRSQAYEIAFAIRNVQLSAVSTNNNTVGGSDFRSVIGIHFREGLNYRKEYIVFRDTPDSPPSSNANGFYDVGEEFGPRGRIDDRFEIRDIRAVGDAISGEAVSVVFVRPNFDARFFDSTGELNATRIEVDIARSGSTGSGSGDLRTIEITATGQIAVQ